MAKRQRLTLQVLDQNFIDPFSEDGEEDHLEEDYSDSTEHSPELDEEVPNEVTDTRNEPVRSASNQVSVFIKPVVQDFLVGVAVFQAVLFSLFATF